MERKPLSYDAIPAALTKVERYRLLNEPECAESICRDILRVEPENQPARIGLILSLTDQFRHGLAKRFEEAVQLSDELYGEYEQAYYKGIIAERRATAHYKQRSPGSGSVTYRWLMKAMTFFDEAEACQSEDNNSAQLRWNTCARMIDRNDDIGPSEDAGAGPELLE